MLGGVSVSDFERSLAFYRGLLGPLGYVHEGEIEGERGERVLYLSRHNGGGSVSLREAQSDAHPAPYDRYAIGIHHICLAASSRATVDGCAAWVREQGAALGGEIESEPREYGYTPGYYAVFVHDPDSIKRARVSSVRIRLALIATVATALTLPVTASSTPTFPVTTTLAGCDAADPISCRIDVGFAPVEGAAGYSGLVLMPDGSSQPLGAVAPGTTAITVPYRGNGTYVVTITALGRGVVEAHGSQSAH